MGRTQLDRWATHARADHPHARGENLSGSHRRASHRGPSPRAWGEPPPILASVFVSRTIPTRVGRTLSSPLKIGPTVDHPHARGENSQELLGSNTGGGPSPRAWGEHKRAGQIALDLRTIPTRVGRTRGADEPTTRAADHPHARGENRVADHSKPTPTGPSPRAWGERRAVCQFVPTTRTIPTRVGRTRGADEPAARATDHPHARGENRDVV